MSEATARIHECPHPTCTKRVRGEYLSCAVHWHELPVSLRLEIYRTYQAEPLGEAHVAAMAKALDHWRA